VPKTDAVQNYNGIESAPNVKHRTSHRITTQRLDLSETASYFHAKAGSFIEIVYQNHQIFVTVMKD
jgi:hypothetical protein